MTLHYQNGDRRRGYLQCDAPNCPNKLEPLQGNVALGTLATPLSSTGWKSKDAGTEQRRDYCAEHADLT
jgi:hypothetical protein